MKIRIEDCYPVCDCCKERITDEKYIEIEDEILCRDCARQNADALWSDYLEEDFLMSTSKYIEDERERFELGDCDDI